MSVLKMGRSVRTFYSMNPLEIPQMIEKKDSGSKPLTVYECVRLEDCKDRWSVLSILLDNEMAAMDPEVSPVPVKEVFRCFRNLGCQVIFASERGTDVGMVVFCVQPKEVIIKELVVVPERRGKGIGKLLVQLVMEWAKDLRLFVGCLGNNERADRKSVV